MLDLLKHKSAAFASDDQRKCMPIQQKLALRLLREGKSVREVARTFSVNPATLYRIAKPAA